LPSCCAVAAAIAPSSRSASSGAMPRGIMLALSCDLGGMENAAVMRASNGGRRARDQVGRERGDEV
jgi:hypothetical protein